MPSATPAKADLLPRAALRPGRSFFYAKDQDAADPKGDDKDKGKDADDKEETETALPQTQEELEALIETAMEQREKERRERAKAKAKKQKERERDDDEDEDDEEDTAELIRKAELKAATAQQRADEAERKALLAEVSVRLRDHLAMNFRDFVGNAPDIMLHIEKNLPSGTPKDAEIGRLIESHSKAFVERSKGARKPASGATVGGARHTGGFTGTNDPEQRRTVVTAKSDAPHRTWSTINYHG